MNGNGRADVAIIGMACVFPGAENLQRYWHNIIHKVDAVSDPPPDWEAELFYDPDSEANDRTYCKRGGFLGKLAEFDPFEFGIMPNAIDGTEPDHFMALRAAQEALADAGYRDAGKLKDRAAVIIGRGTYVNRGNASALQQGVMVDSVLRILKQLHPEYGHEDLAQIKQKLKASLPAFHADTAPGLVPNIISGRIANRLDLMGPNYLIDAACASSLVAVELAVRELETGRCDLALAGGVHACTSPVLVMIFSQLKALSRRGQIRPFDRDADGVLMGEGVGMVVLKRLADAERDGDRIYAVLKGIGVASDGRALGVLAPRVEGEEAALERAYTAAGVDPSTVELIEAHGTGTPVGDAVEMEALKRVFGERMTESPRCAVGSVKSMISHIMPAAGMAGLIKAALALRHKVLPPTLHCENPNPKFGLEKTNFYFNTETRPWIHGSSRTPRRAGVNAFGFGGINAHAVLEEYTGPNQSPWLQHEWDSELVILSGATRGGMIEEARRVLRLVTDSTQELSLKNLAWTQNCSQQMEGCRLAVVATSREDLAAKLERAIDRLGDERTKSIRDIEGIYYFREGLAGQGRLAFLFPGEGSQYRSMLADLCLHFPEVRRMFDLMDRAYENHARDYLPSDVIFPPPLGSPSEQRLWNMDSGAEAVFCANQALYALLENFEIRPDAMVGHSTGEHSALLAAAVVQVNDDEELIRHILGVYSVFEALKNDQGIPEAVLMAVAGADHRWLETQVAQSEGQLHIALDNCIHQVVLCGAEAAIDQVMQGLAGKAAICQKLPFGRAYHTPWFEVFSNPLKHHFDRLRVGKPRVALYSCVTAARYPEAPDEIRALAAVQWARTVRFRETVEAMYHDGVRIFVEVGPRSNLTGFTDDVLRGKPHTAIAANVQHRSGILQLHHLLGQLVAHGVALKLDHLYARRAPGPVQQPKPSRRKMTLATGLQPLRLPPDFSLPRKAELAPEPISVKSAAAVAPPAPAPVQPARQGIMEQHLRTMEQFLQVQQQVMSSYLAGRRGTVNQPRRGPFFNEIVETVPGMKATALHHFSSEREILFHHHAFGREVSVEDPALVGMPFVPLTVTMEILAEAGALLEAGKVLVGMRDIRATRWITLEELGFTIEATAEQRAPGAVHVALREAGNAGTLRPILAEALVLFADRYPESGPPRPFVLDGEHISSWTPERLYREGMFHGPMLQGVKSVERSGRNGASATLEALPHNQLFAGEPQPTFLMDPILLDAAGQVVAYWFWEELERGTDLFPYRVAALDCFAPPPPSGTRLECRVTNKLTSEQQIHSDLEVLDATGKVYYRLETWETRRFRQPPNFLHLRIAPRDAWLSKSWNEPIAAVLGQRQLACCRIDDLTPEFLEASHGIWLKALAYLVLGVREQELWRGMQQAVPKRRREWLLGRAVAKDAVRRLLQEKFGVALCPADIAIIADRFGRPRVEGAWTARLGVTPVVSISHADGVAVALAALGPDQMVGIDIESFGRRPEDFERLAFREDEQRWLESLEREQREEWSLRLWCAKEAVAKALGKGLSRGLHTIHITNAETDTGLVQLELAGGLLEDYREFQGKSMIAYTRRDSDLISSTIVYPQGGMQ